MMNAVEILRHIIIDFHLLIGLCVATCLIFVVTGRIHNTHRLSRIYRTMHITERQQGVIAEVLQFYLSTTFFIVLLMRAFDPETFERYYVYPNVFCAFWILGCLQWLQNVYTKDWKPVGVLSIGKKIQNYVLWFLIYGVIVFMLRDYIFHPLPYYVILPFLAIIVTGLMMKWRNVRRATEEERRRLEEKGNVANNSML